MMIVWYLHYYLMHYSLLELMCLLWLRLWLMHHHHSRFSLLPDNDLLCDLSGSGILDMCIYKGYVYGEERHDKGTVCECVCLVIFVRCKLIQYIQRPSTDCNIPISRYRSATVIYLVKIIGTYFPSALPQTGHTTTFGCCCLAIRFWRWALPRGLVLPPVDLRLALLVQGIVMILLSRRANVEG